MARYFEHGVSERLSQIAALHNDTIDSTARAIDQRVRQLVLLSKDIENLPGTVNLSNDEFSAWARTLHINRADLDVLSPEMHVDEIEVLIRQNELDLLNQLVIRSAGSPSLFTAQ